LFVVRHGATEWSSARRFAGSRDIPLSEDGRRQCEAVARALAESRPDAVWASPLERARTSAEILTRPHRLPVRLDGAFREMGFGQWEGLTREEVAARFPHEWQVWRTSPTRVSAPGGESLAAVAERVAAALDVLRDQYDGQTVILVTHAMVVRLLVLAALGLELDRLWTVEATPGGISELEYRKDWVTLHRMNTLAHLEDAEVAR
jgi:probable phosphoglycerate mutase